LHVTITGSAAEALAASKKGEDVRSAAVSNDVLFNT